MFKEDNFQFKVTGAVMVYRVSGLETVGQLFPNLTRIRGQQLNMNYGLSVFDMTSLVEIGLYSLRKIDRGGVILQYLPQACYLDTIDWKVIAPRARHVIGYSDGLYKSSCTRICTCSRNATYNHCWNIKMCQLFSDGFEEVRCNEQCLGCRRADVNECSTCRHFTYEGTCVPRCPEGTLILAANQYCLTEEECHALKGWAWNNTCVFECPVDYIVHNTTSGTTCVYCEKCQKTCQSQKIRSVGAIQAAERCVYINGSLEIHIRAIPEAVTDLKVYLSRIQEVSDYVEIYGSLVITSLDFLSSLHHIKGRNLKHDRYSLLIYDMVNLYTLFSPNVMKNLRIDRGTMKMYDNPLLCMNKVDELKNLLPEAPTELDVTQYTNGYSASCKEAPVDFQVRLLNETSVVLVFSPKYDRQIHYTVLYVRIPPNLKDSLVPETCSDFQWLSVSVPSEFGQNGIIQIDSLRPASTYAICIETYNPVHESLARTSIINFTTPVGTPPPPFLVELVAASHDVVVLRWVDHIDYRCHITRYELDVALIEHKEISNIDYCKFKLDDFEELDGTRHALVMRPPPEYEKACESMCGVLSSFTAGALVEDFFDVCRSSDFDCSTQKDVPPGNTTLKNYVKTLALNISSPKEAFQVAGLAPYRDYRFRLRACYGLRCSRSARGVVRTLQYYKADIPMITNGYADNIGNVFIKWDPPDTTNGPILAYTVEILPKYTFDLFILPQTWCVSANTVSFKGDCVIAPKYTARICTKTLASFNACSDWYPIAAVPPTSSWYWRIIAIFVVILAAAFIVIKYKKRKQREDLVPIVDTSCSFKNESEPPTSTLVMRYSKSLRESHLE
ncbi:hypothetical protein O3G_MSEX013689 [Manduca sexta]|uniref:Fibronectin type-III domain-containing protein n=1 Tax=Manduca sexta TaxID=7130 RepID=A0A921ZTT8_MANSE|nr:hypothetical protein O3G_MSEX013689 [Manduca sexta]